MRRLFVSLLFLSLLMAMYPQRSSNRRVVVIDSLLKCSHDAYNNVDLLSSMENALEAESLSEAANYSEGRAKSNFYIAQVLSSVGDYDQSLEYLSLAEKERYTARAPLFHSEVSRMQGRVLLLLGLHQSSVRVFKKGKELIKRAKRTDQTDHLLSMAYENLSIVYSMMDRPDSSGYYMEKNRELLKSMDEEIVYRNLINLYGQFGHVFTNQEKYDSATYYLDEALLLADKYQFPYTAYTYRRQGEMEAKRGRLLAALDWYFKGITNIEETGLQSGLLVLYEAVSDIYSRTGSVDSSRYYLDKKKALEKELGATNMHALDTAVHSLLEGEREQQSSKFRIIFLRAGIAAAIVLLFALAWWLNRVKRHKEDLLEKEDEIEELEKKVSEATKEVIELAKNNDEAFLPRFNELYPHFGKSLMHYHPHLIQSEYAFCVLIFLQFTSKEIAQILFIEHRSVQTRKNRLRKKLKLSSNADLYQYLITIEDAQ